MLEDTANEMRAAMHETLMRLLAEADSFPDTLLAAKLAEALDVLERATSR